MKYKDQDIKPIKSLYTNGREYIVFEFEGKIINRLKEDLIKGE